MIAPNFTFCRGREHKTTIFSFCLLARTIPFNVIFWFEHWILVLKCYRDFRERGNRTTAEINFTKVTTFVIKRIHVSDESWISLHPPYKLHKYQNPQLDWCDINAGTSHTAIAEHNVACSHCRSTEFTHWTAFLDTRPFWKLWHSVKRVKQRLKCLNHAWIQQHIQKLQRISCCLFNLTETDIFCFNTPSSTRRTFCSTSTLHDLLFKILRKGAIFVYEEMLNRCIAIFISCDFILFHSRPRITRTRIYEIARSVYLQLYLHFSQQNCFHNKYNELY